MKKYYRVIEVENGILKRAGIYPLKVAISQMKAARTKGRYSILIYDGTC